MTRTMSAEAKRRKKARKKANRKRRESVAKFTSMHHNDLLAIAYGVKIIFRHLVGDDVVVHGAVMLYRSYDPILGHWTYEDETVEVPGRNNVESWHLFCFNDSTMCIVEQQLIDGDVISVGIEDLEWIPVQLDRITCYNMNHERPSHGSFGGWFDPYRAHPIESHDDDEYDIVVYW